MKTEYYSLNCVDPDCQGFSVFHIFWNDTPNLASDVKVMLDALDKGIIDKDQYEQINEVTRITKEEYNHSMNA